MARRRWDVSRTQNGRFLLAGDLVQHADADGNLRTGRVLSYMIRKYDTYVDSIMAGRPIPGRDDLIDDFVVQNLEKIIAKRREKYLPANRRFRYQWVYPHLATHVFCRNTAERIWKISECIYLSAVPWNAAAITETRRNALRQVGEQTYDWYWE